MPRPRSKLIGTALITAPIALVLVSRASAPQPVPAGAPISSLSSLTQVSSSPSASVSAPPDSGEQAAISEIDHMAVANGGAAPSAIDYLEASRGPSYQLLFPNESAANANDPSMLEVVLVAHGNFVGSNIKGPPPPSNAPLPAKPFLYALYSPGLGRVTDWGLAMTEPDIGALGPVSEAPGS